ncbi:MAG: thioredoxin domain-containing protein [Cyanobacteria bacterium J06642_2]
MPNSLATSQSLYLRKHADNPIDWRAWTPEALAEAKANDLPIFLSIGYSSCHWCTVMEGEAFSDEEIANFMNANFLPIKVDREERPDLDNIYMQALQMMVGQGGWPLNIFLDPHGLVPFYGGTYFPVNPAYGRPGFLQVLQAVRQFYDIEKVKLDDQKERMLGALQASVRVEVTEDISRELLFSGLSSAVPVVTRAGMGQQFPMMPYAQLALQVSRFPADRGIDGGDALERARDRAIDLVTGGIFDHVGGGFHRYTVDATWTVPHFEKMLYDNGQILEFLANIWTSGEQDEAIARAVHFTVDWLQREMMAAEGYFYAAQDADSFATPDDTEPEEGEFYVWQLQQLEDLLTDAEMVELDKAFFISETGNFGDRPGHIVLQRLTSGALSPVVETVLRTKLFQVRYGELTEAIFPPAVDATAAKTTNWPGRIPAVTDTKMIVAWNSLAISGLSRAAIAFDKPEYLELATRAAEFIWNAQRTDSSFMRLNYDGTAAVAAKSEDYALFIKALLDLQQATLTRTEGSPKLWLERAISLQAQIDKLLWDAAEGGYFMTGANDCDDLLVREKQYQDNATPAANGIAISNLIRLSDLTGQLDYLKRAERGLKAFGSIISKYPRACPNLLAALDLWHHRVIVKSDRDRVAQFQKLTLPVTSFSTDLEDDFTDLGLVCWGMKCLKPAKSDEQIAQQIRDGQMRERGN